MRGEVFQILEAAEAEKIVDELDRRKFVDGVVSAAGLPKGLKQNLQTERVTAERTEIDEIVISAIERRADLQAYAMPTRFVMPMFSRYEPGMKYGDHVDNALMGGMMGVRTDLAMTIFLTPPSSYDGGELVIEGSDEIKLDVGEAFVYPATSIHHVAPVTRGVRLAVVTWLQSAVRNEQVRAALYDLWIVGREVEKLNDYQLKLRLSKSYQNLIRYAAEPR
ncbi:MAG TPA: Fe2+-dependent dioxygenase [Bryobacteraceae bacterium]|jgi:PKHD-type hydroxylase|nr:Fe2+-dependent dioxygenase [Bryobacteraceae bacterium]